MERESSILIDRVRARYPRRANAALDPERLPLAELGEFVESVCGRWERSVAWIEEHFAGLRIAEPTDESMSLPDASAPATGGTEGRTVGVRRARPVRGSEVAASSPAEFVERDPGEDETGRRTRSSFATETIGSSPARAGRTTETEMSSAGGPTTEEVLIPADEARVAEDVFGPLDGSVGARRTPDGLAGDVARRSPTGDVQPLVSPASGRDRRGPRGIGSGTVSMSRSGREDEGRRSPAAISWFTVDGAAWSRGASPDDEPYRAAVEEWKARGF